MLTINKKSSIGINMYAAKTLALLKTYLHKAHVNEYIYSLQAEEIYSFPRGTERAKRTRDAARKHLLHDPGHHVVMLSISAHTL